MPSITCSKCPATIEVDLPLSPNARYVCSHHVARIEPDGDELVERCEICEARGCSVAFHSKDEIELKAFCRNTVPHSRNFPSLDVYDSQGMIPINKSRKASHDGK